MGLVDLISAALSHGPADVVIDPPGSGPGWWAGAPSVIADDDGFQLACRLRRPVGQGRGYADVLSHSSDGIAFSTVAVVSAASFGAASLERPALIRRADGGWRMYVGCSTPSCQHWWVEAIDIRRLPRRSAGRTPHRCAARWHDIRVEGRAGQQ